MLYLLERQSLSGFFDVHYTYLLSKEMILYLLRGFWDSTEEEGEPWE
jgi:hypothetical protein